MYSQGVDVVVGTPGRVKDHIERGTLKLHKLKFRCGLLERVVKSFQLATRLQHCRRHS